MVTKMDSDGNVSQSTMFTCITCQVIFKDAESQRKHYKSDWHRYNLKRKIAGLPPVTEIVFLQKVDTQTKKLAATEDTALVCQCCSKSFSTKNQYNNHKQSKKHKENEAKAAKKGQAVAAQPKIVKKTQQEVPKQPPNTIRIQPVATVGESSNSSAAGSRQESVEAGEKVEEEVEDEVVVEDDGDEDWEDCSEDEEVTTDEDTEEEDDSTPSEAIPPTTCLFCSAKSSCLEDNARHMSKHHSFFIPELQYVTDIEGFLVYLGAKVGDGKVCLQCNHRSKQFHSVSAAQKHMVDKGHCTLDSEKDALLEFSDFYDFSASYPDYDPNNPESGDTDSDISSVSSAMSDLNIDPSTLELVMPSGARAGHRALRRYYQQSAVPEHLQHQRQRQMLTGVESQYKALGWSGCNLSLVIRKKVDATRRQNQHRQQFDMGVGIRANKLQMRYFRKQYMYAG